MKTELTIYHLKSKDGDTVAAHGNSLKDAQDNCSGGASKWKHDHTEKRPYTHATLIASIVAAMPGWDAEPQSIEYVNCNWYLVREDGLRLFVSMPSYSHKNKLQVSLSASRHNGCLPEVYDNGKRLSPPSIGVGAMKTPAQIAKDIMRRLLPDAEKYNELAVAVIKARDAAALKQAEVYAAICKAFNETPRHRDHNGYFSGGSFEVLPGGSASFKLYSVPADKAVAVAKAIFELCSK